jgi:signal transduction histidine kinase
MKLSKPFMGWDIGLSKRLEVVRQPRPVSPFRALSLKLLASYLIAMITVLGLSAIAAYQFFAYSLFQSVDRDLDTIADAAKHNFAAIERDRTAATRRLPTEIDQDGDLDLPWQDLRTAAQTVEWFDKNGRGLASVGKPLPSRSFVPRFHPIQQGEIRSITKPVFAKDGEKPLGYVRVSMETQELDQELERLLIGLGFGGAIAITAIGITGWYLTRRSIQPIEASVEKLKQFTADASHELRSPITAAKTAVNLIQSHPERVHAADARKLDIIAQAMDQMTELVEDLLLLARTDNQSNSKDIAFIPLNEVLEDLVELLQPQANAAEIQLNLTVQSESSVQGNPQDLKRVFLNLIENAIKYTSCHGTVEVSLFQKEGYVVVTVQDTGIGIASEQLSKVFDRFWQADPSRHRKGGNGLGLAIAQALVTAHQGQITVQSQFGKGSCFRVELPSAMR